MAITHLLLEVFCSYGWEEECKGSDVPEFCKYGINSPGYHCIGNECPFVTYTETPDSIACTEKFGEVLGEDGWIGFGGDMEPDGVNELKREELRELWKKICQRKVLEAYEEYMLKAGLSKE